MHATVSDVNAFGYMAHSLEGVADVMAQSMVLEEILAQKG
jgi:hypothetical protein